MTYEEAQEVYEVASNASGPITLGEAADIFGCGNERGAASHVSAAYWFFYNGGDDVKATTIEMCFVGKDGLFPYKKKR